MAKTALDLGAHWESYIDEQVRSGRYASADEVVREALKGLEDQDRKLGELRREIDEGCVGCVWGEFAEDDFLDRLLEADIADAAP